jgi:hypothetical protein|tara:strand:- start:29 stop:259 length:231 start_codon:yes stop_codon:yes gene_type:complete
MLGPSYFESNCSSALTTTDRDVVLVPSVTHQILDGVIRTIHRRQQLSFLNTTSDQIINFSDRGQGALVSATMSRIA